MKIKIEVKESHILEGTCLDPWNCAISRAVSDIIPIAEVYGCGIYDRRQSYNLAKICGFTDHVSKAVSKFDECDLDEGKHPAKGSARLKYVQPFSFEIEIPDDKIEHIWPDTKGVLEKARELVNQSKNCVAV